MEEHKIDVVGRPNISITKLAPNNPVGFVIRSTLYPEVVPPKNWKALGEKVPLEPYTGELPKADPEPTEEDKQKAREMLAHNIRRGKLVDALVAATEVEVPNIFVESEIDKIMAQVREDIARMGLKFEDYIKHSGKTEDAIRGEFKEQAHKRAKLQLALNKIAEQEKVEAEHTAVDHEMGHALQHFPDANKALLRIHIETVLKNEKVLKMLEGGK